MIAIMHDAIGVGLAATQLGVMHRLLVFQAGPDATPTAVANPHHRVALGRGRDRRGGVSEPARASTSTSSGRCSPGSAASTSRGEPLEIEASGLEARVLQHEIDHLDGVLMLDRDAPASSARRRCGRCARAATYSPSAEEPADEDAGARHDELRIVYLGTSAFAVAVLRRLAGLARTGRRSSSRRPTARAAGAADWPRRPPAAGGARARARPAPDRERQPARGRRGHARGAPGPGRRLRLRAADQGPAAVGARDAERAPVAAAALARGGADRAGDHGRGRARPA